MPTNKSAAKTKAATGKKPAQAKQTAQTKTKVAKAAAEPKPAATKTNDKETSTKKMSCARCGGEGAKRIR